MLPEVKHPITKLVLPSDGRPISVRPYTVQEEKLLITARLSDDFNDVVDTLMQIARNCILTDIDVEKLPMFDMEWIFLNLRKNSVSNIVDLHYDDESTQKKIAFKVDLGDVKVIKDPTHSQKIQLTDQLFIKMRYPTMRQLLMIEKVMIEDGDVDNAVYDVFLDCVESVMDDEKVYTEFTREELDKMILSLPMATLNKVRTFLETMPALQHTVKLKTGDGEKEVTLRGLRDFFTF